MIGILAGALHKKGQFQNEQTGELIGYDNIVLTLLIPPSIGGQYDPIEAIGNTVDTKAKFAAENLSAVFGREVHTINDLQNFIGREVEYFYDGNKKVCRVMLYDEQ